MKISVIIPTYNRRDILVRTLHSLEQQIGIGEHDLEVVVVNDGSTDGTENILREFKKHTPLSLTFFTQDNLGQAMARNFALSHISGDIVLIIGDDIVLDVYCLAEHMRVHTKYPEQEVVCLGYTTWHSDIVVTPFMYFLEHGGPQFNYPKLEKTCALVDKKLHLLQANYWYFYTSNISMKKSLATSIPFSTAYKTYGWEDVDFGYCLEKEKGMRLFYNKKAIGNHYHKISEGSFHKRMVSNGENAVLFHSRYPEVPVVPRGLKRVIFQMLACPVTIFLLRLLSFIPLVRQQQYYAMSKKYFLEGVKRKHKSNKAISPAT